MYETTRVLRHQVDPDTGELIVDNWNVGDPASASPCARLTYHGLWRNIDCSHSLPFICKRGEFLMGVADKIPHHALQRIKLNIHRKMVGLLSYGVMVNV